jgi:hypothetical protein
MALFEFKLPDIGEGVTEGEVVQWHVQEGERVIEDQLMVEVMTDKATVTIGAPKGGKIDSLRADVGVVVQVGDVLVVINTGNGSRAHGGKASNMPAATAVGDIKETLPGTSYFAERRATASHSAAAAVLSEPVVESHYDAKPLATPATRKLARDTACARNSEHLGGCTVRRWNRRTGRRRRRSCYGRRGNDGCGHRSNRRELEDHLANRNGFSFAGEDREHLPVRGRRYLDGRLVRHHLDHGLVLRDLIALLNEPLDDLALSNALADVG